MGIAELVHLCLVWKKGGKKTTQNKPHKNSPYNTTPPHPTPQKKATFALNLQIISENWVILDGVLNKPRIPVSVHIS